MASPLNYLTVLFVSGLAAVLGMGVDPRTAGKVQKTPMLGFHTQPMDSTPVRGQPLYIHCRANTQDNNVTITWTKNDTPLQLNKRIVQFSNGTLFFKRVVHRKAPRAGSTRRKRFKSDGGIYRCFVKDKLGTMTSREATLKVASITSNPVQPSLQNITVTEGEAVQLVCNVSGTPLPSYSWMKNGVMLAVHVGACLDELTVLSNGDLQINRVRMSDAGFYRCMGRNRAADRRNEPVRVRVVKVSQAPPTSLKIIGHPRNVSVLIGKAAMLECLVTGPGPVDVRWRRKDSAAIRPASVKTCGQGNLYLSSVSAADDGTYECVATEPGQPKKTVVASAVLTVLRPPKMVELPVTSQTLPAAKTARFNCEVTGEPPPIIDWFKDGQPIEFKGRVKISHGVQLVIINTEVDDSGYYQCIVQNEAGFSSSTSLLTINKSANSPAAPKGLRAETVSSSKIKLMWEQSASGQQLPIVAYSVQYLPTEGGEELQYVVQDTRKTIEHLLPHTNYSFYVVAYNSDSASQHSDVITHTTGEDVPIVAPVTIVSSSDSQSLLVYWQLLAPDHARGVIRFHKIFWKEDSATKEEENLLMGEGITDYTITGLKPVTLYHVRVLCGTRIGYPELLDKDWPWIAKETLAPIPPGIADSRYEISLVAINDVGEGQPTVKTVSTLLERVGPTKDPVPPSPIRINCKLIKQKDVTIEWSKVDSHMVVYYRVKYYPVGRPEFAHNGSMVSNIVKSNTNRKVIRVLKPNTLYEFIVSSHTLRASSVYSKGVQCKTLEGKPSQPMAVTLEYLGRGDVSVRWKKPIVTNGNIIYYLIEYTPRPRGRAFAQGNIWYTVRVNGTANSIFLSNLELDTVYTFRVRGATKAGLGLYSRKTTVKVTAPATVAPLAERRNPSDQNLGIFIGVGVGGLCILISLVVVVMKNRCISRPRDYHCANGQVFHTNGTPRCRLSRTDSVELEAYTPMITDVCENEHSDSKGGRGGENHHIHCNGYVQNGHKPGHLTNGRVTMTCGDGSTDSGLQNEVQDSLLGLLNDSSTSPGGTKSSTHCDSNQGSLNQDQSGSDHIDPDIDPGEMYHSDSDGVLHYSIDPATGQQYLDYLGDRHRHQHNTNLPLDGVDEHYTGTQTEESTPPSEHRVRDSPQTHSVSPGEEHSKKHCISTTSSPSRSAGNHSQSIARSSEPSIHSHVNQSRSPGHRLSQEEHIQVGSRSVNDGSSRV